MTTRRRMLAIGTAIVSAILPICFLHGAPARSASPHPPGQPVPTVVPADKSNGYAAFSLQLGSNWARSSPKASDVALAQMPSFARRDPKTGKETAILSVLAEANPTKSMINQNLASFRHKKNGTPPMKLTHWGQLTVGVTYFPHFPDGSARLSAEMVGPATIADFVAEYPKPVTDSDKQEFLAIIKSFKLVKT